MERGEGGIGCGVSWAFFFYVCARAHLYLVTHPSSLLQQQRKASACTHIHTHKLTLHAHRPKEAEITEEQLLAMAEETIKKVCLVVVGGVCVCANVCVCVKTGAYLYVDDGGRKEHRGYVTGGA